MNMRGFRTPRIFYYLQLYVIETEHYRVEEVHTTACANGGCGEVKGGGGVRSFCATFFECCLPSTSAEDVEVMQCLCIEKISFLTLSYYCLPVVGMVISW